MHKSKVVSWVMAAVLVAGAGVALAETSPENPEVTTTTVEQPIAPQAAPPKDDKAQSDDKAESPKDDKAESDDKGEQGDDTGEHGQAVSAAAHDHSHDAACGNHGAVVSAVAKTGKLPACASGGPAASKQDKHGQGAKGGKGGKKD
ncbi:MAG: hypothetical protein QOK43_3070 [Acidimicrobiaceae bacterium]|nr:hypothetical protein [Acidimicrobiaceae bacterium]